MAMTARISEPPLLINEIRPGYILWVKGKGKGNGKGHGEGHGFSRDLCRRHNFDFGARGHPCVVLKTHRASKEVYFCLITTKNSFLDAEAYIPAYPTQAEPKGPQAQLRLDNGVKLRLPSYVSIDRIHKLPISLLQRYDSLITAVDHYRLTGPSLACLQRLLGNRFGISSVASQPNEPGSIFEATAPSPEQLASRGVSAIAGGAEKSIAVDSRVLRHEQPDTEAQPLLPEPVTAKHGRHVHKGRHGTRGQHRYRTRSTTMYSVRLTDVAMILTWPLRYAKAWYNWQDLHV